MSPELNFDEQTLYFGTSEIRPLFTRLAPKRGVRLQTWAYNSISNIKFKKTEQMLNLRVALHLHFGEIDMVFMSYSLVRLWSKIGYTDDQNQ